MNYILIGMPGSGKSTLGKLLAKKLNLDFIDFDDDVIEVQKGKTVGELVNTLSEKEFMQMEEYLCTQLNFENTIFSTSGSLPYSSMSIKHLKALGKIIYLKVNIDEIKSRIGEMKTDRIIGGGDNLNELLSQRENLYTNSSDIIFTYTGNSIDEIIVDLSKAISGE